MRSNCITALAVLGAIMMGCNKPATEKEVSLTATIFLDGSANSKALTADGIKTFAADETIAVFYTNESSELVKTTYTFTAGDLIDGGRRATITVSMTEPLAGGAVKYIYPATMANDNGTVKYTALDTQDGTLESLAATLDLATYEGTLADGPALPESVTLSNQLAIGEFTVKNTGGDDITNTVTDLKVTDGTNTYTISRAAADGPIYVAMLPVADTETLTFIATDNAATPNHFIKLVSGKALERNNMYPVNLTVYPALNVAELTGLTYEISDGYWLYGTQTSEVRLQIADGAHVTLAGVTITPTHGSSGIRCLGDATITLAAGSTNTVTSGNFSYAGIFAGPAGKTLSIGGEGTLTASCKTNVYGEVDAAGIGTNISPSTCGDIVITGGTIYANGGSHSAGIGSGYGSGGESSISRCGNITICGGAVVATGGYFSAGIGSGFAEMGQSHCGTVTITAGAKSVTATGCMSIGEGKNDGYGTSCGAIIIDGHELTDAERSNPATTSFTNFNSAYDTSHYDVDWTYTWTLTHK